MLSTKRKTKIWIGAIVFVGVPIVSLVIGGIIEYAQAYHHFDVVVLSYLGIPAFFAAMAAAMVLCAVLKYALKSGQKRKTGMVFAAMVGMPLVFMFSACWVWIVCTWAAYLGASGLGYEAFEFQISSLGLYGCFLVIVLLLSAVAAAARALYSSFRNDKTPRRRSERRKWCLQGMCVAFSLLTMAVALPSLKRLVETPCESTVQWLMRWTEPTAILHMSLAVFAGVELFVGVRYLFDGVHSKAAEGAVLLSLGCVNSFAIWAAAFMMRRSVSLYVVGFQMVCTILLHFILAVPHPSQSPDEPMRPDENEGSGGDHILKRNVLIFCIAAVLAVIICIVFVFCRQKTDNVFDQLYYEVKTVGRGGDSVLLSGTETAYADFDFGMFQNIQIPDMDMCLSIDSQSLYLLFFNHPETEAWNTSYCVLYRYDVDDKKLYGEETISYLSDNFLGGYFQWCTDAGEENAYSLNDLGEYTFIFQETVNYN